MGYTSRDSATNYQSLIRELRQKEDLLSEVNARLDNLEKLAMKPSDGLQTIAEEHGQVSEQVTRLISSQLQQTVETVQEQTESAVIQALQNHSKTDLI